MSGARRSGLPRLSQQVGTYSVIGKEFLQLLRWKPFNTAQRPSLRPMTMGLTRMGWRAYDAVPEPDVPHDQAHQIDLRAQEHAGDLRGDHNSHGCLLP